MTEPLLAIDGLEVTYHRVAVALHGVEHARVDGRRGVIVQVDGEFHRIGPAGTIGASRRGCKRQPRALIPLQSGKVAADWSGTPRRRRTHIIGHHRVNAD